DPQLAAWFGSRVAERVDRFAEVGEDVLAAVVERFAVVGEVERAGAAEQQAHADLLFQPRDRPADTGRGHAQLGGRSPETLGFHHADEARYCREIFHPAHYPSIRDSASPVE